MSAEKTKPDPAPVPTQPVPAQPAPKPAKPIDQAAHGRVRRPHGGNHKE